MDGTYIHEEQPPVPPDEEQLEGSPSEEELDEELDEELEAVALHDMDGTCRGGGGPVPPDEEQLEGSAPNEEELEEELDEELQ